uniref:Uncharacterized protein n=1 Tax=Arundo donax TaxID=35708 RepID=A0A0A9HGK2_ARUDO
MPAMNVLKRLSTGFVPHSSTLTHTGLFGSSLEGVPHAKGTSRNICTLLACCNPCWCPRRFGVTFRWTSLKAFRKLVANLWCLLWSIGSPNMHISFRSVIPIQQAPSPGHSLSTLSGFMGSHAL